MRRSTPGVAGRRRSSAPRATAFEAERALLVATPPQGAPISAVEDAAAELRRLAETAGVSVVGTTWQSIRRRTPATLIGSGKVTDIRDFLRAAAANVVIFDDPLLPAQQRNLERALDVKVLDRHQLILDIFARRARTNEGKLQVELAQLQYLLPRLTRHWTHLSRLGGGVGTRGPGETQLEVDRRRARERISHLQKRLRDVERTRRLHRRERQSVPFPCVALVGYTNSGKSTVMRALTRASVLIEDKLFATLDPTVRHLLLPGGEPAMLIDTVGFINKLPPELIEAFKSTLEEVRTADLLLHIVDVANPDAASQMKVVNSVLQEIGAGDRPVILVFNKIDLCGEDVDLGQERLPRTEGATVRVSALTGANLSELRRTVEVALAAGKERVHCSMAASEGRLYAWVRRVGSILQEDYHDGVVEFTALLPRKAAGQLRKHLARRIDAESQGAQC